MCWSHHTVVAAAGSAVAAEIAHVNHSLLHILHTVVAAAEMIAYDVLLHSAHGRRAFSDCKAVINRTSAAETLGCVPPRISQHQSCFSGRRVPLLLSELRLSRGAQADQLAVHLGPPAFQVHQEGRFGFGHGGWGGDARAAGSRGHQEDWWLGRAAGGGYK